MAWQDEMGALLRVLVNDIDSETYDDDKLEKILAASARLVQMRASFLEDYAADADNATIAPDPTDADARDEDFINLCCLQGACILDRNSALSAASQAIMIRDGSSQIDLRDAFKAKLALIEKGWCAVYADALDEYLITASDYFSQQPTAAGAAILTPFRLYVDGLGSTWLHR